MVKTYYEFKDKTSSKFWEIAAKRGPNGNWCAIPLGVSAWGGRDHLRKSVSGYGESG